jgi:acyl carrier protein
MTEDAMTDPELYDALNAIFRKVLEDDSIVLKPETTAEDVEGWDSMNHIFLVVEIEKHFGVKFQAAEMEELKNVGELAALVRKRIA